mgnify:CR=1
GDQLPPGWRHAFRPRREYRAGAGRLRMQMAHLLGLFAAESFLRGGHDPSLAEIRLALA